MKHTIVIGLLLLFSISSFAQAKKEPLSSDVTTYYFIRHAEKDRSEPSEANPHLKQEGLDRAERWNATFGNIKFDAVYSTEYHRTIETAQPTATKNNLEIILYDPNNIDSPEIFLNETKGKTVLVVGHSNTTPAFVNAILGKKKYENMDDDNNSNLYIVTIIGDAIVDQVLSIN